MTPTWTWPPLPKFFQNSKMGAFILKMLKMTLAQGKRTARRTVMPHATPQPSPPFTTIYFEDPGKTQMNILLKHKNFNKKNVDTTFDQKKQQPPWPASTPFQTFFLMSGVINNITNWIESKPTRIGKDDAAKQKGGKQHEGVDGRCQQTHGQFHFQTSLKLHWFFDETPNKAEGNLAAGQVSTFWFAFFEHFKNNKTATVLKIQTKIKKSRGMMPQASMRENNHAPTVTIRKANLSEKCKNTCENQDFTRAGESGVNHADTADSQSDHSHTKKVAELWRGLWRYCKNWSPQCQIAPHPPHPPPPLSHTHSH